VTAAANWSADEDRPRWRRTAACDELSLISSVAAVAARQLRQPGTSVAHRMLPAQRNCRHTTQQANVIKAIMADELSYEGRSKSS